MLLLKEKISKGTDQMEFLTNTTALSFVEELLEKVNRYEGLNEDEIDIQTTIKYILGMAVDVQIYLTANEMITYGIRDPRLIYNVTVYNHVDGQLSETYTTYELAIALRLFKTEFLGSLDNYYSLKDE